MIQLTLMVPNISKTTPHLQLDEQSVLTSGRRQFHECTRQQVAVGSFEQLSYYGVEICLRSPASPPRHWPGGDKDNDVI